MVSQWEVSWVKGIEDDFSSEKDILRARNKVNMIYRNPISLTRRIKGVKEHNLRRIKIGDHRLFILISEEAEQIYCLAYLPRKKCYSKKSLKQVLKIVEGISK